MKAPSMNPDLYFNLFTCLFISLDDEQLFGDILYLIKRFACPTNLLVRKKAYKSAMLAYKVNQGFSFLIEMCVLNPFISICDIYECLLCLFPGDSRFSQVGIPTQKLTNFRMALFEAAEKILAEKNTIPHQEKES